MKEQLIKQLNDLGNELYRKFGTESYTERCDLHDIKEDIKACNTKENDIEKKSLLDVLQRISEAYNKEEGKLNCSPEMTKAFINMNVVLLAYSSSHKEEGK